MSQSSVTTHKPAAASKTPAVVAPYMDNVAWGFLALLTAAFLGLFYRWFWIQGQLSAAAPADWGHVFVVPLISGFVVWRHRADLARARVMTFWPAVAPLLLAIMAYFFCVVGIKNHMLQGLTIILALFSATLLLLGPALMRYLFLPIAFLIFAITVAEIIMLRITFPLQLSASYGAHALLSVFGVPFDFDVTLSGNAIEILQNGKTFPLNVAEACSGMRMVIAFLALAGCVALLQTKIWWQRVALLLLGPVVAIFMNIIRVTILGLLTLVDPKLIQGEAHIMIGTLLLIPALFLFLGGQWIFGKLFTEEEEKPKAEKA